MSTPQNEEEYDNPYWVDNLKPFNSIKDSIDLTRSSLQAKNCQEIAIKIILNLLCEIEYLETLNKKLIKTVQSFQVSIRLASLELRLAEIEAKKDREKEQCAKETQTA